MMEAESNKMQNMRFSSTNFQARDHYGHTPLHKAVMANQESIVKYLVDYFPELIESRDNVSSKNVT